MKTPNIHIIGLILIVLIFSFCAKPLSKVKFSKGEYKLYFVVLPGISSENEIVDFQVEHKNFYIDNNSVLEKIKNQIILEKTYGKRSSNSFYILKLLHDNEFIDGGILDLENNEILYHNGKYKFDIETFQNYKSDFKKLSAFEVNCVTIQNINTFITFVEKSKGFANINSDNLQNPLISYIGKIDLISDTSIIAIENGWEYNKAKISSHFENLGKIDIIGFKYHGGDSIYITLLCENDISSKLPKGYKIIRPFTDTINIPIQVYDLEKTEITRFLDKRGIIEYEIKNLNLK